MIDCLDRPAVLAAPLEADLGRRRPPDAQGTDSGRIRIRASVLHTINDERAPLSRITAASRISTATTVDVRFPTSEQLDGSDAMNPDPDYSAAYLSLSSDADDLLGAGFVFTTGRGNNIAAEAIQTVADDLVGESVEDLLADMGATYRRFVYDSQLRWLGPEKGV